MRGGSICAFAALVFAVCAYGCSGHGEAKGQAQHGIARSLVPSKAEVKGHDFAIELNDLKIITMKDDGTRGLTGRTPQLRGRYRITNTSPGAVEVQGAIVEYIDREGNPIAYGSDEKVVKAITMAQMLKPGEVSDRAFDLTIPRAAVKDLAKIGIDLVYVPSTVKRETLSLSQRVE